MSLLSQDCPVLIVRLGGLPMSVADGLCQTDLRDSLRELLQHESVTRSRCIAASEALHSLIGAEACASRRSVLLRARRDLYNGRIPRTDGDALVMTDSDRAGRLTVRREAYCLYPTLVWRPCRESLSPFVPFHMVTAGSHRVYVRLDGRIFAGLRLYNPGI